MSEKTTSVHVQVVLNECTSCMCTTRESRTVDPVVVNPIDNEVGASFTELVGGPVTITTTLSVQMASASVELVLPFALTKEQLQQIKVLK